MLHINNSTTTSDLANQVACRLSIPPVSRLFGDPEKEKPAGKDAKKDLEWCFLKSFRSLFLFVSHQWGLRTAAQSPVLTSEWSRAGRRRMSFRTSSGSLHTAVAREIFLRRHPHFECTLFRAGVCPTRSATAWDAPPLTLGCLACFLTPPLPVQLPTRQQMTQQTVGF